MGLVWKCLVSFLCLLGLAMIFKYGVDTCLPDMGSRIFDEHFRLPKNICEPIKQADLEARRNTKIDATGIHFETYSVSSSSWTGTMRLMLARPTIFFAKFPLYGSFAEVFFTFIGAIAFIFATIWQVVWKKIDLDVTREVREIAAKNPEGRRRRVTAQHYLIRTQDLTPKPDEKKEALEE